MACYISHPLPSSLRGGEGREERGGEKGGGGRRGGGGEGEERALAEWVKSETTRRAGV